MTTTAADVWKFLDEQHASESIDETWRSARQLAETWGMNRHSAKEKADKLVREGTLETRRVKDGTHWTTYYRPKGE